MRRRRFATFPAPAHRSTNSAPHLRINNTDNKLVILPTPSAIQASRLPPLNNPLRSTRAFTRTHRRAYRPPHLNPTRDPLYSPGPAHASAVLLLAEFMDPRLLDRFAFFSRRFWRGDNDGCEPAGALGFGQQDGLSVAWEMQEQGKADSPVRNWESREGEPCFAFDSLGEDEDEDKAEPVVILGVGRSNGGGSSCSSKALANWRAISLGRLGKLGLCVSASVERGKSNGERRESTKMSRSSGEESRE
jgi:hypothetical protein